MKWFLDFTTRGKLFVCFGLILALMAWVIATAYTGIATIRESQDHLYHEDFANVRDLETLRALHNQVRAEMLEVQLLRNRAEQDVLLKDVAERANQTDSIIAALQDRAKSDLKRLARLEELKSVQKAFAQTKDDEIIP